jgi:hypothetical protein
VTDDDGGWDIKTASVQVLNVAPTADAGPDKSGFEPSTFTFIGSHTDPGVLDTHTYEWDFDYDGVTFDKDAIGNNIVHTWADDFDGYVALRVTDDDGGWDIDVCSVKVENVPPTASIDKMNQPHSEFIMPMDTLKFTGSFTDPGIFDTHTILWDFGDCQTESNTLTPSHAYTAPGKYTVTLIVTDDDGGVGTAAMEVDVKGPQEAILVVETMVKELGLNQGLENSYISQLENSIKSFDKSSEKAGVNQLGAFINHVEAQSGKKIKKDDAQYLIVAAIKIIDYVETYM